MAPSLRLLGLLLALASLGCGVRGSPRPPRPEAPVAVDAGADPGAPDAGD